MSGSQQAPRVTWTNWNHRFEQGQTIDGYAVCTQCGATENSDEIIRACPKGPVIEAKPSGCCDQHADAFGSEVQCWVCFTDALELELKGRRERISALEVGQGGTG